MGRAKRGPEGGGPAMTEKTQIALGNDLKQPRFISPDNPAQGGRGVMFGSQRLRCRAFHSALISATSRSWLCRVTAAGCQESSAAFGSNGRAMPA